MRGVIPYLGMNGRAGEAADFYVRAFGARDLGRLPDEDDPGRLMHCQLEINGGALMMTRLRRPRRRRRRRRKASTCSSSSPTATPGGTARSRPAARSSMPFERMFWGDRWGMLEDPFGIAWAIDEPPDSGVQTPRPFRVAASRRRAKARFHA